MSHEEEDDTLEGAFGSIRTAVQKLEATSKSSRKIKRETMNQIHALTHELHEVNRNLQLVFSQLSELEGLVQQAEAQQ